MPLSHVARPKLVETLAEGARQGRLLTLVSAPAGYGKSTQIREWLLKEDKPWVWLTLDEADDEPVRFFTYFLAALRRMNGTFGQKLTVTLQAGQLPPAGVFVTELVNEILGWDRQHILVLDDFQFIQNRDILEILRGLLAYQAPSFHLVLITREDPGLPLARLRSRGQLTEIRAADLRFSEAESDRLLRAGLGLDISPGDISRLMERTEGWVAGLQLAGLSLQGRENPALFVDSISGSHRFIVSYLVEEVIRGLPVDLQNFLLETSILPRLCGDLCEAVTGAPDSSAYLEHLLAANLFLLPLDDEGIWYRYHHLFADLLIHRLRRTHSNKVAGLHMRASGWFEQHDLAVEAIDHALAAGDFQRAAELLEKGARDLLNQGYARKIETWLQMLPQETRNQSTRTSLGFAWLYLLRGNFSLSGEYLGQVFAALETQPDPRAEAEASALHANLMQLQGRIAGAVESADRALRFTGAEHDKIHGAAHLALGAALRQAGRIQDAEAALRKAIESGRRVGDIVTEMLAVSQLTLMALHFGGMRSAEEIAARSITRMERAHIQPPPIVGSVFGSLGRIYYEWDQFDRARELFHSGEELSTFTGHNASLIYIKLNLSQLYQAEGRLNEARRALEDASELLGTGGPDWAWPDFFARQVHFLASSGVHDLDGAERILQQSGIRPGDKITYQSDQIHLGWLRWMLSAGDLRALELSGKIVDFARSSGRTWILIQALSLGALAHNLFSSSTDRGVEIARSWLLRALELGVQHGYKRVFLDEGEPLANLLFKLDPSEETRNFWTVLVNRFGLSVDEISKNVVSAPAELVDPLTERELEVLRLLADGLTYARVAEKLVVSINTVRYHVKAIYSKLNVEKQVQAVERARELGFL